MSGKIGRNDPCKCGSGKKYKNCCMDKEQTKPSASLGLKGRKFTAKVLSAKSETAKVEETANEEGQKKIMPVDYNLLMERTFGEKLKTYVDNPPIPEKSDEYLVSDDPEMATGK